MYLQLYTIPDLSKSNSLQIQLPDSDTDSFSLLKYLEFDKLSVSHCISIGFIFKKDKKYIWIFSSYEINDLGEINFGDRTVIPLSNITTMEKIYGKKT